MFRILYMLLVLCTLAVIGAALICYRHIRGHLGAARPRPGTASDGASGTAGTIEEGGPPAPAANEPDDAQENTSK